MSRPHQIVVTIADNALPLALGAVIGAIAFHFAAVPAFWYLWTAVGAALD